VGRVGAALPIHPVGLTPPLDRPVPNPAGGQGAPVPLAPAPPQARAQALAGRRARGALLLDEPVAALDLARRLEALDRLREVARAGLAVLVVLHDLDLAARAADRVVILEHGAVAAAGAPSDVLTPALLARVFGVRATVAPAPWDPTRPWIGVEGLAPPDAG